MERKLDYRLVHKFIRIAMRMYGYSNNYDLLDRDTNVKMSFYSCGDDLHIYLLKNEGIVCEILIDHSHLDRNAEIRWKKRTEDNYIISFIDYMDIATGNVTYIDTDEEE